mgnify:CR=1 FL=1
MALLVINHHFGDDGMSKQTKGTLDRIFNEASRFGGLDNITIDDSEYEEDDM